MNPIIKTTGAAFLAAGLTLGAAGCAGTPKPTHSEVNATFAQGSARSEYLPAWGGLAESQDRDTVRIAANGHHRSRGVGAHPPKHGKDWLHLPKGNKSAKAHETQSWFPKMSTVKAVVKCWFKTCTSRAPKKI